VRIALIGAGRIGRMHARMIATLVGADGLIVVDPVTQRAEAVAVELGARTLGVTEALSEADGVVIAAATDAHPTLVRASLARGLPTFCEKPLAPDLDATLRLAADIERSGVAFQLGFQRRFDPGYREARRRIESGDLGTIYAIRMAGHDPAPPAEDYIAVSGGLFRDFSVHDFDILRWLTGVEVAEVYAMGGVRAFPVFAKHDDVDTAVATFRLTDGTLGAMTIARHDPLGYDIRTEVFGSRDSISVGLSPRSPIHSVEPNAEPPVGPPWPGFMDRFADAYRAEMSAFLRVARGEAPSECGAADGVASLRVAEAMTQSMQRGEPVRLADIPMEAPM
jgi:myo-inositol 2-dehydrogenase / D-chiro-inositol 1-dehydrogenase